MAARPFFRKQTYLLVLLLLLTQFLPPAAAAAQSNLKEHVAVVLILDDSGSMEGSDPTNLRYTAAQLFVSLLDEGDAVGALRFSTNSTPITTGMETFATPAAHTALVNKLAFVQSNGATDVKKAFEEAGRLLSGFDRGRYQTVIIFLTDGNPEISNPYPEYEQESLDAAKALGLPFLSIALTNAGQSAFLTRLSNETGGRVILAKSAADLLDSYLQLLGDLKDRTVVGAGSVNAPGQAALSLDPALMPYVARVSFVVSKPSSLNASLTNPAGQTVAASDPAVDFSIVDPRFAVYSLPAPAGGDWSFQLGGSGAAQARAILVSRLRARLVSPTGSFEAGQTLPLVVRLVEEQPDGSLVTVIGEASFAAWITRPDGAQDSLDQFYDDGTHGDAKAGDGLFTREYVNTQQAGMYDITIRGSKGSVPVSYHTQIQGVAFPHIALDQPSQAQYDIRANPVPLQIHLAGAEPAALDQGDWIAVVTAPSGAASRVPLSPKDGGFAGQFLPRQDGLYQVRFEVENGLYQGLPYAHTLETSFTARLIPTLTVQTAQVGLQASSAAPSGRFEVLQAQTGIPLVVTLNSSSAQTEQLTARLEGMPGFTLQESGPQSVAASGVTTLTYHLLADAAAGVGTYTGQLSLSSREGIDLRGSVIPISIELYQPSLSLAHTVSSAAEPGKCYAWAPVKLTLNLNLSSGQSEQIRLRLDGLPGVTLSQDKLTAAPGESQVELQLLPEGGKFAPGKYSGKLLVEGLRPGLELSQAYDENIEFQVSPLLVSCAKPLIILGAALLGLLILIIVLIVRARQRSRPPLVTGTLIHWRANSGQPPVPDDLTGRKKQIIKIGTALSNDIAIDDPAMQAEHAQILVARGEDGQLQFTLRPIAPVWKGYRSYTTDLPLEEKVEYKMGDTIFTFVRDIQI